ncbi:uncharacterized protein LOC133409894 [Phycodurus eques]|uniref:uncharacterized protein LOC133409894 n=1 Tax=Phycodurus eques TaxID=693459 RepID=UPI002ACDB07A|nr:uncharacterized protein LOC133409894 [Phycodurus eques]
MSEPRTLSTATVSPPPSPSKVCHGKSQNNGAAKKEADVSLATVSKALQSPQRRGYIRSFGLNHGDSPGDADPSQDIVWDSRSPTNPGRELKNVKTVEIADIVNRIAPKDTNPRGPRSPLWQWISDSPAPATPKVPKARMRKKSFRQSSVEDLIKLARQFDENMQQDKEDLDQLNADNESKNKINKTLRETSSLNQTEAELRALFDSSTQKVTAGLSQVSSKSSQDKSQTNKSSPGPEKVEASSSKCADFDDDDWENDDMLNDPSLLALMQNPDRPFPDSGPVRNSPQSGLRDLCPKVKRATRSTFKLEPNPHFQTSVQETSKKNISDCKWDDVDDDDALFYQACDSVERLSQPIKTATTPLPIRRTSPGNRKSPRSFTRSNSLPSGATWVRRGRNAPVSKSLPAGGRATAALETSQAAFKRSVCHAATANGKKVFVTSQMAVKCSAAEIERKKQEALARRRQRLQNTQKQ